MSILLFFAVLLLLVIVHEFGHFIIAKRAGIRVDEFAFGFPPRIWSIKRSETTYSFNMLPLGGYVKIYGENPDDIKEGSDPMRSFTGRSRWMQGSVILGGVIFNLLLAWLLIASTLMIGVPVSVDSGGGYAVKDPELMVTGVYEKSPAADSGLIAGDTLLRITDGKDTVLPASPESVTSFIERRGGHTIMVTYERGGETKEVAVSPVSGIVPDRAAIGIYMDMVGTLKLPFYAAIWEGLKKTYLYTKMTATGIGGFLFNTLTGHSDFSQVTGPVGIVKAVGSAAHEGVVNLLLLTALISINLAVINVLPFPALDGGRLLFIVIEGVMKKPIKPRVANMLNFTGFALLMLLMLFVTYHDVLGLMK